MVRFWVDPTIAKRQLICSKGTFIKKGAARLQFGDRAVGAVAQIEESGGENMATAGNRGRDGASKPNIRPSSNTEMKRNSNMNPNFGSNASGGPNTNGGPNTSSGPNANIGSSPNMAGNLNMAGNTNMAGTTNTGSNANIERHPNRVAHSNSGPNLNIEANGVEKAGARRNALKTLRKKSGEPEQIRLGRDLQQMLRLPDRGQLHLNQQNGVWRLGPCLGLYVTRENNPGRMFGEQTRMLEEMTRYGHERGIDVVVLTPGFTENGRGWRFDVTANRWVACQLPLPDVVLRRSGRFHENGAKVTADLRAFERSKRLHSLPRNSSNKWTFYQAMQQNNKLQKYLPRTVRVRSAAELKTSMRQMKDAYLKPINGAQGISIHRLRLQQNGGLKVTQEERVVPRTVDRMSTRFHPQTRIVEKDVKQSEIDEFWQSIQGQFRQWILQESVSLLHTTDGRPVDFRWLVQYKDGPMVTGRVARVGAQGAITTNLHTGGQAMDAKAVVEKLPGLDVAKTLDDMDELAQTVFEQLRSEFGPFAEVGIDLGIDKSGRVFAFEVNPTPGRRMLRSLSDNIRELSLINLVEYAIKASGFSN